MCGLLGVVGKREVVPILLDGLRRVEYRGYDSAGIAVADGGSRLRAVKAVGRVADLEAALVGRDLRASVGIAHTRWATHGPVLPENAHPLLDCTGTLAVAHNGIVENHVTLHAELANRGHGFASTTDTEVICHLLEEARVRGVPLERACASVASMLQGGNVFLALDGQEPGTIVGVRVGVSGGLVVGLGEGETCLVSDLAAIPPWVSRVVFVEPGEVVALDRHGFNLSTLDGRRVSRASVPVPSSMDDSVRSAAYPHRMAVEIAEQPETVATLLQALLACADGRTLNPDAFPGPALLRGVRRVVLTGCGTSYHAALVGRHYLETLAGVPAQAELASELVGRQRLLGKDALLIAISQSGETADVLTAMAQARDQGCRMVAICNVQGSQAMRLAHHGMLMLAGRELAVASTKTFMASLVSLYLLSVHLGLHRRVLSPRQARELLGAVAELPQALGVLAYSPGAMAELAQSQRDVRDIFVLGRGILYPIALEGALKLKEVSYVHAEGVAGGEIKHGPISLADERLLVLALAFRGPNQVKMLNNVSELRARGAQVVVISDVPSAQAERSILVPQVDERLAPMVAVVPLQQLSYYLGVARGVDVDKPRNLAKVVAVE